MLTNALKTGIDERTDYAGRVPFMGFATDQVTRAALLRAASKLGWPDCEVLDGSTAQAVRILAAIPTPGLLVIDLSSDGNPLESIAGLAEVCDGGTRLIALGDVNDVSLFRGLMELGVRDYMLKPVSPDALAEAMGKSNENKDIGCGQSNTGRLVCMIGARGGVGASTVAVNCAWSMANEQNMKVALVDLDLYFGTTALSLDLEPGRGFREALENPSRIDDLFIKRALAPVGDNLFVLGAEESLDNTFAFDRPALDLLLDLLLASFDCVVVDVPRIEVNIHGGVLAVASEVVIVTESSLAGMRDTLRLAAYAAKAAPQATVNTVINRAGNRIGGELSKEDFESGAGLSVDHVIPLDIKGAAVGAAAAKPLVEVAGNGKAAVILRRLAQRLSGRRDETKAPLWRRLLRRNV